MKKVLLICGTGASSGFMAANTRKAMKAKGREFEIIARSDSELEEHLADTDLVLIGPHLSYMLDEVKEETKSLGYDLPIHIIDKKIYGILDGQGLSDFIISILD